MLIILYVHQIGMAKRLGDVNAFQAFLQMILPTAVGRMLGLTLFDVRPYNALGNLFKDMIKKRRETGQKYGDLSELLDDAINEGLEMSEAEKIGNCLDMLPAGIEPMSNALSKIFQFLVENEECKERLCAEVKEFADEVDYDRLSQSPYLDAFINESLRLGPMLLVQKRVAMKNTKIGEFSIEKSIEINLIPYLCHTSAEYWPGEFKGVLMV